MTTSLLLLWLLAPLLALVAIIDLATMSQQRRIRLLSRSGASQRSIAQRLGVSRYAVRCAIAGA